MASQNYKFRVNGGKQWFVGEVTVSEAEAYDGMKRKSPGYTGAKGEKLRKELKGFRKMSDIKKEKTV